MQRLKKVLQYKYSIFIILVIVLLLSYYRVNLSRKSVYSEDEKVFKLTIVDKKYKNGNFEIIFKAKEKFISHIKDFPYDVGDVIEVKGSLNKVDNNTVFNNFNYQKYLQSRGINWELKVDEVKLIKKNKDILFSIKNKVRDRIANISHNEYLFVFLLGDTSYFSEEQKDMYQLNGLSYLLTIGSLQMYMLIKLLEKIEERIRIRIKYKKLINILVIIGYILLTNMAIGILRSGLCYIVKEILNYLKIKIKYYKIILLVGVFLLIINPYYVINIGFLYSFSISLGISLFIKREGNYFKRLLEISLLAFTIGLPITLYNNYEINILSIILSIIYVSVFNYLIFPFSFFLFLCPFLSPIFDLIIKVLESTNIFFNKINFLTFIFRKPSIILILIYYFIIILFLYRKKNLIILIIALFIHNNVNKIIPEQIVTFLDVKEGDSILLKLDDKSSLIDTGGNIYNNFSKKNIKYIKSLGLSKIDYLILSHGDFDHMGEAINLVNNFKVEKVIFNCGGFNDLESELINVLDKKKIKYYSCIKELKVDNNKLYFLQTKEYDNENDNSNVIYIELDGYKFMFMGDASTITEKEILNKYNLYNIDVLKVGHHGSKTSSAKGFINEINPKYSIISVGKNNRYGHPNKEVLNNLKDSKIYRTDQDGSIMFKIKNNGLKIETCRP